VYRRRYRKVDVGDVEGEEKNKTHQNLRNLTDKWMISFTIFFLTFFQL